MWMVGTARAQSKSDVGWPTYSNDPGGTRYSPAAQIDRGNVGQLKVAWTFRTGALPHDEELDKKAAFEATPILVDGKLFLSTPYDHVIALNAETGAKLWEFDPKLELPYGSSEVTSRGVSAWRDPHAKAGKPCTLRIFIGTLDARLIALDGGTGKPCKDFGMDGEVDLTTGVRLRDPGDYQVTSAPAIFKDLIITGSSLGDNRAVTVERGIVRAFDVRTGNLRWTWIPSHPGLIKPRLALVRATPGPRYQWTRNTISPSSLREAPAPTILEASGKAITSGRILSLHSAPAQANSFGDSRWFITIYGITT